MEPEKSVIVGEIPRAVLQLEVVMTQIPDLGRHQVVSPEAGSITIGLNHPQRPPIRNEVPPFIQKRLS